MKYVLKGGTTNVIDAYLKEHPNDINIIKNNLKGEQFENNLNLFSYWISSSHNTYLPYDQIYDPSSLCYYKIFLSTYFGGCVEIDPSSLTENGEDIYVTHLPTNTKKIKLSKILKICFHAIKVKKERHILSGPLIITFDNKNLKTKNEHIIFWKLILGVDKEYPGILLVGDKKISDFLINELSFNILLRWSRNSECFISNDELNSNINNKEKVGKELCQLTNSPLKIHITKSSFDAVKKVDPKETDRSMSITVPNKNKKNEINIFTILNTQRNLIRTYPYWTNVQSNNYLQTNYLRNGVQMTALNLQYLSHPLYYNMSIFLPKNNRPCKVNSIINFAKLFSENKHNNELTECKNGWKNDTPQSYRLKPLWLLGLIPHPGIYSLNIEILDANLKQCSMYYMNIGQQFISNTIIFKEIDPTIPFYVIEILEKHKFRSGFEIPWNFTKLSGEIEVTLFNFNKKTNLIKTHFNEIELNKENYDLDCDESSIINIKNALTIKLKYKYTLNYNDKNYDKYNQEIVNLRHKYPDITQMLNNIQILKTYQEELASLMQNYKMDTDVENKFNEDVDDEILDIKKYPTAKDIKDDE